MAEVKSDSRRLKELIAKLPEVYQPIYGHPEYDPLVARRGDERLAVIQNVYAALRHKLGRSVRVLDLGCAQGWISLNMAYAGASVLGVDHYEPNIAVCNVLASEDLGLSVRFERADIEELPGRLKVGDFDLVLGLSVFHHLCAKFGQDWGRDLIVQYIAKIPNAILELALATEQPAWAKFLPENPEYFISDLPFFSVLAHNKTHLQSSRPLYFCSRTSSFQAGEIDDLPVAHGLQPV